MGPSGAGKSTLMDILAQRKSLGNLTGSLLVNGQPAPASFIKQTSYVPQVCVVVCVCLCWLVCEISREKGLCGVSDAAGCV